MDLPKKFPKAQVNAARQLAARRIMGDSFCKLAWEINGYLLHRIPAVDDEIVALQQLRLTMFDVENYVRNKIGIAEHGEALVDSTQLHEMMLAMPWVHLLIDGASMCLNQERHFPATL